MSDHYLYLEVFSYNRHANDTDIMTLLAFWEDMRVISEELTVSAIMGDTPIQLDGNEELGPSYRTLFRIQGVAAQPYTYSCAIYMPPEHGELSEDQQQFCLTALNEAINEAAETYSAQIEQKGAVSVHGAIGHLNGGYYEQIDQLFTQVSQVRDIHQGDT